LIQEESHAADGKDKYFAPWQPLKALATLLRVANPGLGIYVLEQGIPIWGTCTLGGAFAYINGYIYRTAATLPLRDKM